MLSANMVLNGEEEKKKEYMQLYFFFSTVLDSLSRVGRWYKEIKCIINRKEGKNYGIA